MKGCCSTDCEYDYILRFRTNSALSNETHLTIKSQTPKRKRKKHHPIYWATVEIMFYNHISLWEKVPFSLQILLEQLKKKHKMNFV